MTEQPDNRPGDLWIGVEMPTMTETHAKFFDCHVVSIPNSSNGKLVMRLNLSAFVRYQIAEATKKGI